MKCGKRAMMVNLASSELGSEFLVSIHYAGDEHGTKTRPLIHLKNKTSVPLHTLTANQINQIHFTIGECRRSFDVFSLLEDKHL